MAVRFGWVLALMALGGCSRTPVESSPPGAASASAKPSADCPGLFEPPAGATLLCDQHDLATDAEVHWRSFATADARGSVEQHYRTLAERCGAEVKAEANQLGIGRGPQRLSVHDASPKAYPGCDKSPSSQHRTVVIVSSMFRR